MQRYIGNLKTVFLGITNRCNCKCLMCDIGLINRGISTDSFFLKNFNFDEKEYANEELIDRIFEQLTPLKPTIGVTGGEPLISERFQYF